MLKVSNLVAGYGRVTVLRDVSITLQSNEVIGLLGANGAGKTTLIRALSGLATIQGGEIEFDGRHINGIRPEKISRQGLVQVPQQRMLFQDMKVHENLEMGAYHHQKKDEFERQLNWVEQMFPILRERRDQIAGLLSGGEQQMLAVARALMAHPKCLLLDEPSLGLAPRIFDQILEVVDEIRERGIPVLIAEQNARKVLRLARYAYVLENGKVATEGPSEALLKDRAVQNSYLGAGVSA